MTFHDLLHASFGGGNPFTLGLWTGGIGIVGALLCGWWGIAYFAERGNR